MAFSDSFKNSMQKAFSNSFSITPEQIKNPLSIEKSGLTIIPTYQESKDKYGQEKDYSYESRLRSPVLRKMYEKNVIVRVAIDTIINEECAAKWDIKVADSDEKIDDNSLKDQEKRIKKIKNFFKHPNENRESFRIFLEKVMWDLLLYDAGCIEKVKNSKGELKELYSVAGDTIRVKIDKHGKLLGYYQVIEGSKEDPIYFDKNQLTDFLLVYTKKGHLI